MEKSSIVRKVYRSFVVVSILTALTATLGMLIDNIIVGRYLGENALGAMGIISPISLVFSAFGNICSGGGTARAAQALGKGDSKGVSNIFTITMLFVFVTGGILTAVGWMFAPQIALLLGAKGALIEPATDYLRGFFLGAIPTIMTTALMGFLKIDGSTRLPLVCIAVMTVSNIILDFLMIFVFQQGMFGMALATSIAYTAAVLTGLSHFGRKYCTLKWIRPSGVWNELIQMVKTGAPTALSRICDTVKVFTLNNLLVAVGGTAAVAALNIRTQTSNIVGALIMGVCQAIIPVAGVFYGEEDKKALQKTLKEALRIGLLLSGLAAFVLLLFPGMIPGVLGVKDTDTLKMATLAISLYAVCMPLQLINTALMNLYQSTRNTASATLICIMQQLAFTTVFSLILVNYMGENGIWLSFLLGEICTLLMIGLRILHSKKGKKLHLSDVLLLPEQFGGNPEDRLEIVIGNSIDEVTSVANDLYEFGGKHQLPRELINKAILCIEEMAGNVVHHSFTPHKEEHLELLVYNKPKELIIRIRDNQMMFDPIAYLNTHEPSREHMGIRLTKGVADHFVYRRTIGLNNLLMVLKKERIG